MASVASRELRNETRALLDRVQAGERIVITVSGQPVAELRPIERRRGWISRSELLQALERSRADAALTGELASLAPDTTDDLDW